MEMDLKHSSWHRIFKVRLFSACSLWPKGNKFLQDRISPTPLYKFITWNFSHSLPFVKLSLEAFLLGSLFLNELQAFPCTCFIYLRKITPCNMVLHSKEILICTLCLLHFMGYNVAAMIQYNLLNVYAQYFVH